MENPQNLVTPEQVHVEAKNPLFQVTPLSKYLAMILFIALPFLGFWLGMEFQKSNVTENINLKDNNTLVQDSCPTPSIEVSEKPGFGFTTSVDHEIELTLSSNQPDVVYSASDSQITVSGINNGVLRASAPKQAGVYSMTITATNSCGAVATKDLSFNIIPFINIEADLSDARGAIINNPGPTILNGKSVLLSWRFLGSSDCKLTSDADTTWSEKVQTSSIYGNYGEKDSGPLTRSLTYTLRCSTETGLENSDSVKVTVLDAATPAVDLDARESKKAFGYTTNSDGPLTILPNTSAILSWDSQNVNSCLLSASGDGQISGITGVSKSGFDTGPLNGETTYRVDCQSSRGPVSDSVTIKTEGIGD